MLDNVSHGKSCRRKIVGQFVVDWLKILGYVMCDHGLPMITRIFNVSWRYSLSPGKNADPPVRMIFVKGSHINLPCSEFHGSQDSAFLSE